MALTEPFSLTKYHLLDAKNTRTRHAATGTGNRLRKSYRPFCRLTARIHCEVGSQSRFPIKAARDVAGNLRSDASGCGAYRFCGRG
jgi:hypothetical protein